MSRLYGALLNLEDYSRAGAPASLDDVAAIAFAWAGVPGADGAVAGRFGARNNGDVIAERFEQDETGALAWRMAFQHPDGDDPLWQWRTIVTAVEGAETRASVEVHRFSSDGSIRASRKRGDPPRLVRDLAESKIVRVVDADIDCRAQHKVVTPDGIDRFVAFALDERRRLPIVLFTEGGSRGEIDYALLQRRLTGVAHVVVLEASASWGVAQQMQRGITPWGGWTRLWWPGFSMSTPKGMAPVWPPTGPADAIVGEIEAIVLTSAAQSFAGVPEFARVRELARDREIRDRLESIREGERRIAELAAAAADEGDSGRREAILQEQVEALQKQVAQEVDRANNAERNHLTDLEAHEEAIELLEREKSDLMRQIDELVSAQSEEAEVARFEDAAREFRQEMAQVHASWPDHDQKTYPIGPTRFHEEFFTSLVTHARNKRKQTVEKCTLLACNRIDAVDTKEAKPPAGQEHRRADGAVAMRADLEHNTPAARRIQYWRLTGGEGLEFVRVANHDDFATSENSRIIT